MKLFTRNRLFRDLQAKHGKAKNGGIFKDALRRGFTHAEARRMLLAGNKIRVQHLAKDAGVSGTTIFNVCDGKRTNPDGQAVLSKALDVPVHVLFQESYSEDLHD